MVGLIRVFAGLALAVVVAGCDGGASAVPVQQASTTPAAGTGPEPYRATAARADPVRRVDGKPMWSASRRYTAEENAERSFQRNGQAFGATTLEAFVAKAHAFVSKPPRGAQTLTRSNGDTLIYDPASNVFAVATRDGAPRTMFKPDEGAAYWDKVKAREAEGGARPTRARDEG